MAEPFDPVQKIRKLSGELVERRRSIDKASDYYDGVHNLAFASEKFREAFGGLFDAFADNWCGVVVDAVEERLHVQGFRVDPETAAVDSKASDVWKANELDLQATMGHADGLIAGAFFVTVWPDDDGKPEITVESPRFTIVEHHPKQHRRRTAALRTWMDEDGYEHAELFTPEEVWLYRSRAKVGSIVDHGRRQWIPDPDAATKTDAAGRMAHAFGTVPVVQFLNRPRLTRSRRAGWGAHSEIARIMPLQDAVNKLVADLLVTSEFAAFPQRWLTGFEPEEIMDPETGEPTGRYKDPTFRSGPGVTWWTEETEAKFGAFPVADLKGLTDAVELLVQHIASISATPPHYLRASADRLSGESIKSAESGLVAKVGRRAGQWGSRWAEVMHLAGVVGNIPELKNAPDLTTVWGDWETRTESEHVDALSKKKDLGVPLEQLWEEAGYDPATVARFPAMRATEQLSGAASTAANALRLATTEANRLATGGLPTTPGA